MEHTSEAFASSLRARTGRGPDAGRTIAFEETDAGVAVSPWGFRIPLSTPPSTVLRQSARRGGPPRSRVRGKSKLPRFMRPSEAGAPQPDALPAPRAELRWPFEKLDNILCAGGGTAVPGNPPARHM
eukprot:gene24634-biopygen17932